MSFGDLEFVPSFADHAPSLNEDLPLAVDLDVPVALVSLELGLLFPEMADMHGEFLVLAILQLLVPPESSEFPVHLDNLRLEMCLLSPSLAHPVDNVLVLLFESPLRVGSRAQLLTLETLNLLVAQLVALQQGLQLRRFYRVLLGLLRQLRPHKFNLRGKVLCLQICMRELLRSGIFKIGFLVLRQTARRFYLRHLLLEDAVASRLGIQSGNFTLKLVYDQIFRRTLHSCLLESLLK
jgi:hypothetical protein